MQLALPSLVLRVRPVLRPRIPALRSYTSLASAAMGDSSKVWPHKVVYQTRWLDNDQYGHLNNSTYYLIADSIINAYLVNECGIQPFVHSSSTPPSAAPPAPEPGSEGEVPVESVVGLVISNSCRYFASCTFPTPLLVHLRVVKLGSTSVTWQVGIREDTPLSQAAAETQAASGQMAALITSTHVFVDRHTRRPAKMAPKLRTPLQRLLVPDSLSQPPTPNSSKL